MNLYLHNKLKPYFSSDPETQFKQLMVLKGDCYRELEGRSTHRVQIGDQYYFIKQHRGVGFGEIVKNLFQGRLPVLGAKNEKIALEALHQLDVPVPMVLGYGERGGNPARLESFIILQELAPTISLEDLVERFKEAPPRYAFKRQLIAEVARMVRIMHENGINHRDCYLCHFLLDTRAIHGQQVKLYLIDLHRAQTRRVVPTRWKIKDLAGLFFSSLDAKLTRSDYLYFICQYRNKPLRDILKEERLFWEQVRARGEQLYRTNKY